MRQKEAVADIGKILFLDRIFAQILRHTTVASQPPMSPIPGTLIDILHGLLLALTLITLLSSGKLFK